MVVNTTQVPYQSLVQTLVTLVEARNPYNLDHCKLVAHYCDLLSRWAGLDLAARERLEAAARMHTLGLLLQMEEKTPHQQLPVTGPSTRRSRDLPSRQREEEILRHLLDGADGLRECVPIILQRHEWFDGSGSAWGLHGEDILAEARILAVADAFVDLATPKCHRIPLSVPEVLRLLQEKAGTQFEPRLVEGMAQVVGDEEERWGVVVRERRFVEARCRHWLGMGNLHRQMGDANWALRCYREARSLADRMRDVELEMDAVAGQFMVYCDAQNLEPARQILTVVRGRTEAAGGQPRRRFLLMWGVLEWMSGQEQSGEQILEDLARQYEVEQDVVGLTTAVAHLAALSLVSRGAGDPRHLRWLRRFMRLAAEFDLFDVIEQYRPHTLPLLISAVRNAVEPAMARAILTQMGEPCQDAFFSSLDGRHPREWMDVIRRTPVDAASQEPFPAPAPPVPIRPPQPQGATAVAEPRIQVRCLGPLLVTTPEGCIRDEDWPSQKAMKLFSMVASRGHAPVPDATLMEAFWPESDELRARHSLRNALHQVRSLFQNRAALAGHPPVLERSRRCETISLHPSVLLDVEAFESGIRQGVRHAQRNPREAVTVLQEALSLYRGPFLENHLDEWVLDIRTHFHELRLKGLLLLTRCLLLTGDPGGAEATASTVLEDDDLREEAHSLLIEALRNQRRRADALRRYQDSVVHFQRQLGITPTSLTALYDSLLVQAAS